MSISCISLLKLPHLLLGCGDLVLDSSPSVGTFSRISVSSSSSSGCCTSRWMWLGEEGQGEAAEEPWAGESWEEEVEDEEEEEVEEVEEPL